jgi:hypothetical protein
MTNLEMLKAMDLIQPSVAHTWNAIEYARIHCSMLGLKASRYELIELAEEVSFLVNEYLQENGQ